MKVLWFSNTPANASTYLDNRLTSGAWLALIDKYFQEVQDIELSVVFIYHSKQEPFKYLKTSYYPLFNPAIKTRSILKPLYKLRINAYQKVNVSDYLEIIEKVNPDIIHIHGTENAFGSIQNHTKIPIVFSIQSLISVYELKYYSGIPKAFFQRIISFKIALQGIKYALDRKKRYSTIAKLERNVLSNAKFIIGRTQWDKRVSSILAPKARYFHNDEILRNEFKESQWQPRHEQQIVLHSTIGSTIYKGLETIYFAASLLKDRIDFKWNIAGLNKDKSVVKIVEKYTNLEHQKLNINLLGALESNKIVANLLNSDIFIHPSHIENSSNSICEAMMLGIPIIATYTGGTNSLLQNDTEGILIQDGDPYSLAGAVIELVNNPEKAKQFGLRARERAFTRHDVNKIVHDLKEIYNSCIKNSSNANKNYN